MGTGDHISDLNELREAGIPLVAMDRIPEDYAGPSVSLDNLKSGRMAAEHLLDLGHSYIGHISGPLTLRVARERGAGFQQAIRNRGLEPGPLPPLTTIRQPFTDLGTFAVKMLIDLIVSQDPLSLERGYFKMSQKANYKAELVGVFGHPVAENPTVVMHEAAFKELGLNWRYLTIEVYPQDLADAMKGLHAFNMRGINLTIPHKVEVLKYLDQVKEARAWGAYPLDGVGMLVYQGAIGFHLWTGLAAPVPVMYQALAKAFGL